MYMLPIDHYIHAHRGQSNKHNAQCLECDFWKVIFMGFFIEIWQESAGRREGSVEDLKTGIKLGIPWAQLRYMSTH